MVFCDNVGKDRKIFTGKSKDLQQLVNSVVNK